MTSCVLSRFLISAPDGDNEIGGENKDEEMAKKKRDELVTSKAFEESHEWKARNPNTQQPSFVFFQIFTAMRFQIRGEEEYHNWHTYVHEYIQNFCNLWKGIKDDDVRNGHLPYVSFEVQMQAVDSAHVFDTYCDWFPEKIVFLDHVFGDIIEYAWSNTDSNIHKWLDWKLKWKTDDKYRVASDGKRYKIDSKTIERRKIKKEKALADLRKKRDPKYLEEYRKNMKKEFYGWNIKWRKKAKKLLIDEKMRLNVFLDKLKKMPKIFWMNGDRDAQRIGFQECDPSNKVWQFVSQHEEHTKFEMALGWFEHEIRKGPSLELALQIADWPDDVTRTEEDQIRVGFAREIKTGYDILKRKYCVKLMHMYGKVISDWSKERSRPDEDTPTPDKWREAKLLNEKIKKALGLNKKTFTGEDLQTIETAIKHVIRWAYEKTQFYRLNGVDMYNAMGVEPFTVPEELLALDGTWDPAKISAWQDIVWRSAMQYLRETGIPIRLSKKGEFKGDPVDGWKIVKGDVNWEEPEINMNAVHATIWRANAASRFAVVL